MTTRNVRRRLAAAIELGHSAKVTLTESYGSISGYPMVLTRTLVVFQDVSEFHFDGWEVVPITRIEQVRSSRFERPSERMMKAEGKVPAGPPPDVRCGSFATLFESLAAAQRIAIVETDVKNDDGLATDHFYIGRILSNDNKSLRMLHFTITRGWDKYVTTVEFGDIMSVGFGGEYEETWSRHLPPLPPVD